MCEYNRHFREHDYFLTMSFETIAACDSNAASAHYNPTPQTNKPITQNSTFLIDAGAHYLLVFLIQILIAESC